MTLSFNSIRSLHPSCLLFVFFSSDLYSVSHVRKTLPLESLRELAEEIGFISEDVSCFSRLLEMNVLAPRLGDRKIVEDTHAWGQEETRRRGTLVTQVG
jgi:hypothetical protein